MAEDSLGKVLRAHLYIERAVNELIDLALRYPEIAEKGGRSSFGHRIHLAAALGLLRCNLLPPLKGLNAIRNEFAHDPTAQLTSKKVDDLINSFSEEDKYGFHFAYEITYKKLPKFIPKDYNNIDSSLKFAFVTVALFSAILACKNRMDGNWPNQYF